MRIQIGTKVKFLNEVGGGVVRGFSQDKYALVETDDGFEIQVLLNELLPDPGQSFSEEDIDKKEAQEESSDKAEKDIGRPLSFEEKKFQAFEGEAFLAVVPQNEHLLHVSNLDLYLINDSNYSLNYAVSYKDSGVATMIKSGIVEPDTKIEISEYSQSGLSKLKEFHLQGFFYKEGLFELVKPLYRISSIADISFYKTQPFSDNEYFHQKALILKDKPQTEPDKEAIISELEKADIGKVIRSKEGKTEKISHKSPKNQDLTEIDLHIEEIVEETAGMSNGEMLQAQMARFETALETGLRSKSKKIVFIHGVRNCKLKHELRKTFDRKYRELRYQDASFKEYGYGATLVYLK